MMTFLKQILSNFFFCFVLLNSHSFAQDFTCSASSPCAIGCCSAFGSCGFGPDFCGDGNCTSNCDAKAECGQYAAAGDETCPLNVCCSQYGFCGTTESFCGTGCQNGCDAVQPPSGSGSSAKAKTIGYYESWAYTRDCDAVTPEDIDATIWTHLNYAFALIDPSTFKLSQMNTYDTELYPRFINLKKQNPKLKAFISVGGWDAGGEVFSKMASTAANRAVFIQSAVQFCRTYAFDGIDIDWEYPVADDRGGNPADFDNFVAFIQELKAAAGSLGVTLTLPSSYWYLQGFDIVNLEKHVDWFNIMSYDIHGTWDGQNPYTQKVVNPHTNLTEISLDLDLLWRNNISPRKVVLGLGFYGRSFTLADPSCTTPGCPFSGGANPGECTKTSGVLSNAEIERLILEKDLTAIVDNEAGVKYIVWDSDQWVSYDDADTLKLKVDFANGLNLGGTMVWAVDLDSADSLSAQFLKSGGTSIDSNGFEVRKLRADNKQSVANKIAYWTPCMSDSDRKKLGCPGGYHEMLVGHGKVYDADLNKEAEGCHGNLNRVLCLSNEVIANRCQWNRKNSGSKLCDSRCPAGTIFLTQNTHPAGDKTDCAHGTYISVCCDDLQTTAQVCTDDNSLYDGVLSGGLSGSSAPGTHWEFYNPVIGGVVPSKREVNQSDIGVLEFAESDVEAHGGIEENEVASTIVDIKSVASVVPHGGQLRKRADDGYNPDYPCDEPYYINFGSPPSNLGYVAVYGQDFLAGSKGSLQTWATNSATRITLTRNRQNFRSEPIIMKTCDGALYPQPCHHYRSVGSARALNRIPCPEQPVFFQARDGPGEYYGEHHAEWRSWNTKTYLAPNAGALKPVACQADEWPPFDLWRQRDSAEVWIRYSPGPENGGVLNYGLSRFRFEIDCQPVPLALETHDIPFATIPGVYTTTVWVDAYVTSTVNIISYTYINMGNNPADPDRLTENQCWPRTLSPDAAPGFALLNEDPYYYRNQDGRDQWSLTDDYEFLPAQSVTQGKNKPTKRSIQLLLRPDNSLDLMMNDGNSSRPALEHEIKDAMNFDSCSSPDCKKELAAIGFMLQSQLDISPDEAREQMQSYAEVGIPVPATVVRPSATLTDSSFASERTADKLQSDYGSPFRTAPHVKLAKETGAAHWDDGESRVRMRFEPRASS